MAFTHYPKLDANIVFAWVWPRPPKKPGFLGRPSFDHSNRMREPLAPGKSLVGYHSAQNFTRYYGSIAADQPLEVSFSFSNDEVTDEGDYVTNENISTLHYDAVEGVKLYDPAKQKENGKFFILIYGRWLRVEVKNTGKNATELLRVYVRGSVF